MMHTPAQRTVTRGVYALVVAVALLLGTGAAGRAAAATLHSRARASAPTAGVASGPVRARITGRPILGTGGRGGISAAQAAPGAAPPQPGQIKVLEAALARMTTDYPQFANQTPGPQDIFDYGIGDLWRQGNDGSGTTIALLEGWNDPTIAATVASFDQQFGLPNPHISTIYPAGPLPKTCPAGMVALGSYGSCSAWQGELDLDVITAHLIAPYAKILLAVTPADTVIPADAAQNVAPPEMMKSLEDISRHHLADVVSVSDNTGETTYSNGTPEITAQTPGELAAASAGIPFLVATGDCGVVQNLAQANAQCEDAGTTPSSATWDDSPWATAVGGSVPNVSTSTGAKLGPDPLWHDPPPNAQFAEGAGFSSVFARPAYQDGVASITGSAMRSVPDLTMDAQDGTSESTPMIAGVLALATQVNGADLGPINPALYALGPRGAAAGIADVVSGNNSADAPDGTVRVPGFQAAPGFDVASGWGTVYAPRFVPSLVAATRATGEEAGARRSAARQLASLQTGAQAISLSPSTVASDGASYLSATGFLPGYPVTLRVAGRSVATLGASSLGDVTDMIDPSQLGLGPGHYTVTLQSLLIDEAAQLTVR